MISHESLCLLHSAISIFNKRIGKEYLIAYSSSKKQPLNYLEIRIEEKQFWHLLGCRVLNCKENNAPGAHHELYQDCLVGKDVSSRLEYTRKAGDVLRKYNVFIQLFDFVEKARVIRICIADETQVFEIGAGNIKGLIGYSKEDNYYFPITTLNKSIYEIDRNTNNKIFSIRSRNVGDVEYNTVEYEIVRS